MDQANNRKLHHLNPRLQTFCYSKPFGDILPSRSPSLLGSSAVIRLLMLPY